MQYQGGKARHARHIAKVIAPRGIWWEPFCGGLSVSARLAQYGPGIVSDANAALIALYRAVRDGWIPPERVTVEEWHAAKLLPDTDPLKAFIGVGCSYAGIWFSSPDVRYQRRWLPRDKCWALDDTAGAARRALLRDIAVLSETGCRITGPIDFNKAGSLVPDPAVEVVYCDPPYIGTAGYSGVAGFDHAVFWARCAEIAGTGRDVYVSEFSGPPEGVGIRVDEVWNRASGCLMAGRGSGLDKRSVNVQPRMERLYRVIAGAA